jgi:hypothetical protein
MKHLAMRYYFFNKQMSRFGLTPVSTGVLFLRMIGSIAGRKPGPAISVYIFLAYGTVFD